MAKKNPPLNVLQELGVLLSGDSLETLIDELADPGCQFSRAEQAKLGAALEAVGKRIYNNSKDGVNTRMVDGDVVFEPRSGGERTNVDTALVKKLYPERQYPDLYKKSYTADSVAVSLPFDKDTLYFSGIPIAQNAKGDVLRLRGSNVPAGEDNFPDFGGPVDPFA